MDYLSFILKYSLGIYVFVFIIDRTMSLIRFRIRERSFAFKYPTINFGLNSFITYLTIVLIFIFTVLQEKTHFIQFFADCDPLILTVSIYAMYGILISFIQFLISYSSTNNRDFYWGKSKTKLIIMDSMEYKIFNSTLFRLLLMYLTVYSVINFNELYFFTKYTGFANSLFNISIVIVMVEFIILFIKGVIISNMLFYFQEDVRKVNDQIEMDSLNEYQYLFNESIKSDHLDFMKIIFFDLLNIQEAQRREMIFTVLNKVYSWQQLIEDTRNKSKRNSISKTFKRHDRQNSYYKLSRVRSINCKFWIYYKQNELKLSFKELLEIYIIQENFMFHIMKLESYGEKEKFSSLFEAYYEADNILIVKNNFFDFPSAVWDAISSQKDIILFCYLARKIDILDMLYNSYESSDYCCTEVLGNKIIQKYCDFIIKIIKEKKETIIQMDNSNIEDILDIKLCCGSNNYYNEIQNKNYIHKNYRDKIKKILKNKIMAYLITLDDNKLNLEYISKFSKFLDVKYVMFFIIYRVLYPGDDYSEWKKETLYFKRLISPMSYDNDLFSKQNVDFIVNSITKNTIGHIGHKINPVLIKWIFENIKLPIDENIVNECHERRYLSLTMFISLKYIFLDEYYYYDVLEDVSIISEDIKFQFINEMSKIKDVLQERYFIKAIFSVFGYRRGDIKLDKLIRNGSYEMFVIISSFITIEKIIECIDTNVWIENNEVLNFLLIKFSEFGNQKILLSLDFEVQQNFARQFERMLTQSNKTVDEYVDALCDRVSFLGDRISQHRKDKAIQILRTLVSG
jgi:hypothetical protein